MADKLCKLVKDGYPEDKPKKYRKLVESAEYICKKCARTASDKSNLCKPDKM